MDVDTDVKKNYKSAEWFNQGSPDSFDSTSKTNRSTIFHHAYFWSLYLLAISYILDVLFYLIYYQKKFQTKYYYGATYVLRVINDTIFLFPILIFIKFAVLNKFLYYIIGAILFMPQLLLSIISLIMIYNQDYCSDDNFKLNLCNEEYASPRILDHVHITILRSITLVNFLLYIIAISLTFLKIIKNY